MGNLASQKEFSVLLKSVRKLFTHFIRNANCFPEGVVNYITQKMSVPDQVWVDFLSHFQSLICWFSLGFCLQPSFLLPLHRSPSDLIYSHYCPPTRVYTISFTLTFRLVSTQQLPKHPIGLPTGSSNSVFTTLNSISLALCGLLICPVFS